MLVEVNPSNVMATAGEILLVKAKSVNFAEIMGIEIAECEL